MVATSRKPLFISMMTWFRAPLPMIRDAPSARLRSPETMAASLSAPARSMFDETAIRRPSDDTAIASSTPMVLSTKLDSSQLKFLALVLMEVVTTVPLVARDRCGVGGRWSVVAVEGRLVAGPPHAHLEARQCRA